MTPFGGAFASASPPARSENGGETPLLAACGLRLGYGGRVVLDGVNLAVRAGEFWCLVGPNGSGKSTFVHAVLGLLRPLAGTLRRAEALASSRDVGFVPQRVAVPAVLPCGVREFVSWGFVNAATPPARRAADLAWALGRTGLTELASGDMRALSGGQARRAVLARALVRRPRLLVLDEPTTGLDFAAEAAFMACLAALHRDDGLTPLLVTHDLRLAARHADRVALFAGGSVVAGEPAELLTPRRLERLYGMAPPGFETPAGDAPDEAGGGA